MRKKHGLTHLHCYRKWAKNEKKAWTNPFTFFENGPKMRKKDELTPLHFFENGPKMRKKHGLSPLHFSKMDQK